MLVALLLVVLVRSRVLRHALLVPVVVLVVAVRIARYANGPPVPRVLVCVGCTELPVSVSTVAVGVLNIAAVTLKVRISRSVK